MVFGYHKDGFIFPMLLNVRESPSEEGPPAFIAVMRSMPTSEEYIFLLSDYTVAAGSVGKYLLLYNYRYMNV